MFLPPGARIWFLSRVKSFSTISDGEMVSAHVAIAEKSYLASCHTPGGAGA